MPPPGVGIDGLGMLGRRYGSGYGVQVGRRRVRVWQGLRARLAVLVSEEPMAQGQL
jgi:hypothetical protein